MDRSQPFARTLPAGASSCVTSLKGDGGDGQRQHGVEANVSHRFQREGRLGLALGPKCFSSWVLCRCVSSLVATQRTASERMSSSTGP